MLLKPDCIPCILRMSLSAIRGISLDDETFKVLFKQILDIPALKGNHWDITSPEVIEEVTKKINNYTGNHDLFGAIKSMQNQKVMEMYPFFQKLVDQAPDPLYMAVKLAILGNAIDVMISDNSQGLENSISGKIHYPISEKAYEDLKIHLRSSKLVVYFSDNSGEIVLDKLLIETIKKYFNLKIVFVVRGSLTLNDATIHEAHEIGLYKIVLVSENGVMGSLPGTILHRCSSYVNDLVKESDIIISKGGGNFDTLEEENKRLNKTIAFMLVSKCTPYIQRFNVPLYYPVLELSSNISIISSG